MENNLLTRDTLIKMKKDDVIEAYLQSADLFRAIGDINANLKIMSAELSAVKQLNSDLTKRNEQLERRLIETERLTFSDAQYSRRHLLELNTSQGQLSDSPHLKETVARLMSLTGTNVAAGDIDVCHTIGKEGKKRVIMEMNTRTQRYAILQTRKNLKNIQDDVHGSIFISESVCDPLKKLEYTCRKLKKNGALHSTWFWNGRIHMKITENGEKVHVGHLTDILKRVDRAAVEAIYPDV